MPRELNSLSANFSRWGLLSVACLSLLILLVSGVRMLEHSVAAQTQLARVINQGGPDVIPDQYMVVFKPGTARSEVLAAESIVERLGGKIEFRFTSALIGFSVNLRASGLQTLRAASGVAWIEADQKVKINVVQPNPPNGLDRTSERLLPLNQRYTYSETGTGVNVYVIDTGIRVTHSEFGVRAHPAFTAIADTWGSSDCGNMGTGHGTHVAGTIGGTKYGIAKNVSLHAVRVLDCNGIGTWSGVIAGVDWVTNNAVHPAVANMSLGGGASPAIDLAVTNSIASGVTYTVAAGNNGQNACNYSPARVPTAITVGAVNPIDDHAPPFSNYGPCLDLFAPGVGIVSSWNASDTATKNFQGTSMAAPHVAGVAAFYLENNPLATPAAVWGGFQGIHYNNNVSTTPGWAGVINPGPGSPNELLYWGSLNDGYDNGDPHIATVSGTYYDFQSAGEFITLRDAGGLEIQTRKTPAATPFIPGANPYTGLASCVSINTAVAARVGNHRVTFQPNRTVADPNGLELRVDGVLTTLGTSGLNLGSGGRVVSAPGGGIEIDFPDGTALFVTPGFWTVIGKWYLNLSVLRTRASEGIMGSIAPGSWLPALPNGTSLGPKPSSLHQRYVDLNQTFADAWRVTNTTSLFDYAPGTSTATFTLRSWPQESGACVIPRNPPVKSLEPKVARQLCREIVDKTMNANCVFDVAVTGEAGFAKTYLLSQQIRNGSTKSTVNADKAPSQDREPVTFTATVKRNASSDRKAPTGTVQFTLDGERVGEPVKLDSNGRAAWKTSSIKVGEHRVAVSYIPSRGSGFLASISVDKAHTVTGKRKVTEKDVRPVIGVIRRLAPQ